MRFAGWTVLLALLAPVQALGAPIGYATVVDVNGFVSQHTSPSDSRSFTSASLDLFAEADLASGALRLRNAGSNGAGGAMALFYDTLTFAAGSFGGVFGSSYDLTLTAAYDGTYGGDLFPSGAAGTGGRIHVYSGATVVDSSVFADTSSLIDFMFVNGPAPLCAQGVDGPDFSGPVGPFSFSVSCTVTVTAASPTVKVFMNLPSFFNGSGLTWNLDMTNTGTLSLGDLGGRTVYSASGALPGTLASPALPEPSAIGLMAMAVAAAAGRRRARRAAAASGRE